MEFTIPDDRRYAESHEWTEDRNGVVRVGITDFAQDELGDIVFIELPTEGDDIEEGDEFGVIESIKAVSDVYAPISGTVTDVNEAVFDKPELVNDEPFSSGWLIQVETDQDLGHLLSASEYRDQI
ncbi:glycine cleavage system protein GcvH [Halobium palmae]|uniref:Probable glycine cleavage system H protein n=1 Tax=Halobium palmae TaxID=1776492 RepID=A0ABD5RU45_9EURY